MTTIVVHHTPNRLRFERDGVGVAEADLSAHTIALTLGARARCDFALSLRGVEDAVGALSLACRRGGGSRHAAHNRRGDPRIVQESLFAVAPAVAFHLDEPAREPDAVAAFVRNALLQQGTMTARGVCGDIEAVVNAVHRERETPLPLSAPVLLRPFLSRDVLRFRPAAIAVALLETLPWATATPACLESLCVKLQNWRSLFSPTGVVSRALNKTLDELGPTAASDDLWALRAFTLDGVVRSHLHLRLLAERALLGDGPAELPARQAQLSLVQRANEDDLTGLVDDVARAFRRERADTRERAHLFAELLAGTGLPRAGATIGTVVNAALDPGRRRRRRHALDLMALPPIPLPRHAGLSFLHSAGELIDEGEQMEHCVATRINAARRGDSFVFHYKQGDQGATIEVNAFGVVVGASGIRNAATLTAARGAALLRIWGARFWVARVTTGGLATPTWAPPGPLIPFGKQALGTVGALLQAYDAIVDKTEHAPAEVADWFEENVALALAGRRWLVGSTDPFQPEVVAVDEDGEVVAGCGLDHDLHE